MKLLYRIVLRLSLALLPVMALLAMLFYFAMVDEINDEADDALDDYAELVMRRFLAGKELPEPNSGSNNSYFITPVSDSYAKKAQIISYYDEKVYIPEKEETEPARVLKTLFRDADGKYYELQVATPTFEREDLLETVACHIIVLYIVLMVTVIIIAYIVLYGNMRPLYRLLTWLDEYRLGAKNKAVPDDSGITEFHKLSMAAQQAMERVEYNFEQQKLFIGNASHELQTPLAILSNRIEWLIDNTSLDEEQLTEMLKMQRSLSRLSRLNKTLLLLSKIENRQFNETTKVNISAIIRENVEIYNEIYCEKEIVCNVDIPENLFIDMNESLASILINNLLKNSFLHNNQKGNIQISLHDNILSIANSGSEPLDRERIFERFYHKGNPESTGLGLPLVSSVCRYYDMEISYEFRNGMHVFSVKKRE